MSGDATVSMTVNGRTVTADLDKVGAALIRARKAPAVAEGQSDIEDVTGVDPANEAAVGGLAVDRLRSLVERIERLEEERKALTSDINDIYVETKSAGFDVKVVRQLVAIRKREPAEVEEQEALLDVYRRALGM